MENIDRTVILYINIYTYINYLIAKAYIHTLCFFSKFNYIIGLDVFSWWNTTQLVRLKHFKNNFNDVICCPVTSAIHFWCQHLHIVILYSHNISILYGLLPSLSFGSGLYDFFSYWNTYARTQIVSQVMPFGHQFLILDQLSEIRLWTLHFILMCVNSANYNKNTEAEVNNRTAGVCETSYWFCLASCLCFP